MADSHILYVGEIVSYEIAKARGLNRYFLGSPCRSGHIDQRATANRNCLACLGIRRNRVRQADLSNIRRLERLACLKWREEKPHLEKARQQRIKARREERLAEIAGRPRPDHCELCGQGRDGEGCNPRTGISFDHDHATGKFRGWLCDRCNKVLGLARDNAELLSKLADYVKQSQL